MQLNGSKLMKLVRMPEARRKFPFLRNKAAVRRSGCSSCKNSPSRPDLPAISAAIARLSPEEAVQLLGLLGMTSARIAWVDNDGKTKTRDLP